jgi:hypothetical protein
MSGGLGPGDRFDVFRPLAKASRCLKRCGLKYPHDLHRLGSDLNARTQRKAYLDALERLNAGFGVVGRLERVGADYPEIWFWENDDGTVLNTKNF